MGKMIEIRILKGTKLLQRLKPQGFASGENFDYFFCLF
jgi:hypothetical protein